MKVMWIADPLRIVATAVDQPHLNPPHRSSAPRSFGRLGAAMRRLDANAQALVERQGHLRSFQVFPVSGTEAVSALSSGPAPFLSPRLAWEVSASSRRPRTDSCSGHRTSRFAHGDEQRSETAWSARPDRASIAACICDTSPAKLGRSMSTSNSAGLRKGLGITSDPATRRPRRISRKRIRHAAGDSGRRDTKRARHAAAFLDCLSQDPPTLRDVRDGWVEAHRRRQVQRWGLGASS